MYELLLIPGLLVFWLIVVWTILLWRGRKQIARDNVDPILARLTKSEGSTNTFYPFALLIISVVTLSVSLFVSLATLMPTVRSLDQTIERQEKLNKAMILGTINQAKFLVEQDRSNKLVRELNKQLSTLVGEGDE